MTAQPSRLIRQLHTIAIALLLWGGGGAGALSPLAAQSEVVISGHWVDDTSRGASLGITHGILIGPVRVDTVIIAGQPIPERQARLWLFLAYGGVGVADAGGSKGAEISAHAAGALMRRFPNGIFDQVGLSADLLLPQGAPGVSLLARSSTAFWLQVGTYRHDEAWKPAVSVWVQKALLDELCRYIHLCS